MSILLNRPRPINIPAEDKEPGEYWIGDPPNPDEGEVIPPRLDLSPADLESIVRFGHTGDEPVPGRVGDGAVMTPEQLEDYADRMEIEYAARTGRQDAPGYAIGIMISRYRMLHAVYLDKLAELDRLRLAGEFWPDEVPSLDPADYYDPEPIVEYDGLKPLYNS